MLFIAAAFLVITFQGFFSSAFESCDQIRNVFTSAPSGVYNLNKDGETIPFYCDLTTEGGGWTLVYKISRGAGPPETFELWEDQIFNEVNTSVLNMQRNHHYRSRILSNWIEEAPYQVLVLIYREGIIAKKMVFNASGSDSLNWFAPDRVMYSPWNDLPTDPEWDGYASGAYFSIYGANYEQRRFYINNNWDGCSNDFGWLLIGADSGICEWEGGPYPKILFSSANTGALCSGTSYIDGDVFAVFVRGQSNCGDGVCDPSTETCLTCVTDCGCCGTCDVICPDESVLINGRCVRCPNCVHGVCTSLSTCLCDSDNWSGFLCDQCASGYFGESCEPIPAIVSVAPSFGRDIGGSLISIIGHNLLEDATYECVIGSATVPGTYMNQSRIRCPLPSGTGGSTVDVELLMNGSPVYRDGFISFRYLGTCPADTLCNDNGICSLGSCICYAGWTGSDCTVELYLPDIEDIPDITIPQGSLLISPTPVILSGSLPIKFALESPLGVGATINTRDGVVTWQDIPMTTDEGITVTLKASNQAGVTFKSFQVYVVPGYTVTSHSAVSDYLPVGAPVQITGYATSVLTSLPTSNVPVELWIEWRGHRESIYINTISDGYFYYTYTPSPNQGGLIKFGSKHPGTSTYIEEGYFEIIGIVANPNRLRKLYKGFIGSTIIDNSTYTLQNVGDITIPDIEYDVQIINPPSLNLNIGVQISSSLGSRQSTPIIITLSSDLDGSSQATGPIDIKITFRTTAEDYPLDVVSPTEIYFTVDLDVPIPNIAANPSTLLGLQAPQSVPSHVTFHIRNLGQINTGTIGIQLPSIPWMTLATPSTIKSLSSGGEAAVTILFSPSLETPLGRHSGIIRASATSSSISVPFEVTVVSSSTASLIIRVEDEFTYYADGKPLVANATITISNGLIAYQATSLSSAIGIVQFDNIPTGLYQITATKVGHARGTITRVVNGGRNTASIFLSRNLVSYVWNVVPTTIDDTYVFTLQSTFETNVPAPVITIEPSVIDKSNFIPPFSLGCNGTIINTTITFTITNHGLIRADNVRLSLPSNDEYIWSENLISLGDLPGKNFTKYSVQLSLVFPRNCSESTSSSTSGAISGGGSGSSSGSSGSGTGTNTGGTSISGGSSGSSSSGTGTTSGGGSGGSGGNGGEPIDCNDGGGLLIWELECDGVREYSAAVYYTSTKFCRGTSRPPIIHGDIGNYIELGSGSKPVPQVMEASCGGFEIDNCTKSLTECVISFSPLGCATCPFGDLETELKVMNCIISCTKTAAPAGPLWNTYFCYESISKSCKSQIDGLIGKRSSETRLNTALAVAINQGDRYFNWISWLFYLFGDYRWLDVSNSNWAETFTRYASDESENGIMISDYELQDMLIQLPAPMTSDNVTEFVLRWNRTVSYWEQGILSPTEVPTGQDTNFIDYFRSRESFDRIKRDTNYVLQQGYLDIEEAFLDSIANLDEATRTRDEGICARVKIQIDQEVVMTRNAFHATLEIDNSATVPIDNIVITLFVRRFNELSITNNTFSISQPTLTNVIVTNGNLSIGIGQTGKFEWTIIPTREAAGSEPVSYDISGTFSYTISGAPVFIPLSPATITVFPDPLLHFRYFWSRDVFSDDPFTPEIEPAIPFYLGLQITNSGYGTAYNMRIATSQPYIIENEKGLVVSFKIIDTQVGTNDVTPSLAVSLGDISSNETLSVKWTLTCPLQGTFTGYNASFEHINSFGDPSISLIDSLDIHELIHVVKIDYPEDDQVFDFLANDIIDNDHIPDTIYSSNGNVLPVFYQRNYQIESRTENDDTISIIINSNVTHHEWVYYRIDITEHPSLQIGSIVRSDNKIIQLDNVWRTYRIRRIVGQDPFAENFLHILDHSSTGNYNVTFTRVASISNVDVTFAESSRIGVQWTIMDETSTYSIDLKKSDQDISEYVTIATSIKGSEWIITNLTAGTLYNIRISPGTSYGYDTSASITTGAETLALSLTCTMLSCNSGTQSESASGDCYCDCSGVTCDSSNYVNSTDCSCAPFVGCSSQTQSTCEDGNLCTINDICAANGTCIAGELLVCLCEGETCNPSTGRCPNACSLSTTSGTSSSSTTGSVIPTTTGGATTGGTATTATTTTTTTTSTIVTTGTSGQDSTSSNDLVSVANLLTSPIALLLGLATSYLLLFM